ncbi:MAG: hypothetical protein KC503_15495 [Myxococcales bacterium]|nr:hypothetical protein [Myxococcales bacterium]
MSTKLSRKDFLLSIAAVSGVGALLAACGGDDNNQNPSQGGCSASAITANHGHTMTVTKADVAAAANKTYDIKGSSGHAHSVTLTAADFAQLAGGAAVTVTSTNDAGHTHDVTVMCAS